MLQCFLKTPQQPPRETAGRRNAAAPAVATAAWKNVPFAFHSPICSQLGMGMAPLRCGAGAACRRASMRVTPQPSARRRCRYAFVLALASVLGMRGVAAAETLRSEERRV